MLASVATLVLSASACGPPQEHVSGIQACWRGNDGIILLAWTIRGSAPSSASCSSADHITLTLATDGCGTVEIDPIPCTLDKFRYDHLPQGNAIVSLAAVDARDVALFSGSAPVDLSPQLPSTPTHLDLR
jgi:hypothetical protein